MCSWGKYMFELNSLIFLKFLLHEHIIVWISATVMCWLAVTFGYKVIYDIIWHPVIKGHWITNGWSATLRRSDIVLKCTHNITILDNDLKPWPTQRGSRRRILYSVFDVSSSGLSNIARVALLKKERDHVGGRNNQWSAQRGGSSQSFCFWPNPKCDLHPCETTVTQVWWLTVELATRLIWEQNAMQVKDNQEYGGWQLQLILDHLQYCVFSATRVSWFSSN